MKAIAIVLAVLLYGGAASAAQLVRPGDIMKVAVNDSAETVKEKLGEPHEVRQGPAGAVWVYRTSPKVREKAWESKIRSDEDELFHRHRPGEENFRMEKVSTPPYLIKFSGEKVASIERGRMNE